jgi:flagellin
MRSQIRGLSQASRNAQDGISLIQTAEGALNETQAIMQRMRQLAVQSATGTNTDDDRSTIQNEIDQLTDEIDRIGNTTEFNTKKLLNGELKSAGGSTVSQDSTVGSVVAKQTAGVITSDQGDLGSGANQKVVAGDFKEETLTIDGTDIKINWQNLSSDDKNILTSLNSTSDSAALQAAKDLIIDTINQAIDDSGANVEHVSGYINATDQLVIESGTTGTDSTFAFKTADAVLSTLFTSSADTIASANAQVTAGTSLVGTATSGDFNFTIGDIDLQGTMAAVTTASTMDAAAIKLQSAINNAIASYNAIVGSTSDAGIKNVSVNATDDGRFEILSETGEVSFSDIEGSDVVEDLGLDSASVSSSGNGGVTFQIGASEGQTMDFGIGDMRATSLGVKSIDVSSQSGAENAITKLDDAISKVSAQRSQLGAVQNRLEHTIKNLDTSAENLQASESRIRDVDMAKEMMSFTKNNILQQAAQSMLAQANQAPQGVLQLLR